jgi:hypothetical protein
MDDVGHGDSSAGGGMAVLASTTDASTDGSATPQALGSAKLGGLLFSCCSTPLGMAMVKAGGESAALVVRAHIHGLDKSTASLERAFVVPFLHVLAELTTTTGAGTADMLAFWLHNTWELVEAPELPVWVDSLEDFPDTEWCNTLGMLLKVSGMVGAGSTVRGGESGGTVWQGPEWKSDGSEVVTTAASAGASGGAISATAPVATVANYGHPGDDRGSLPIDGTSDCVRDALYQHGGLPGVVVCLADHLVIDAVRGYFMGWEEMHFLGLIFTTQAAQSLDNKVALKCYFDSRGAIQEMLQCDRTFLTSVQRTQWVGSRDSSGAAEGGVEVEARSGVLDPVGWARNRFLASLLGGFREPKEREQEEAEADYTGIAQQQMFYGAGWFGSSPDAMTSNDGRTAASSGTSAIFAEIESGSPEPIRAIWQYLRAHHCEGGDAASADRSLRHAWLSDHNIITLVHTCASAAAKNKITTLGGVHVPSVRTFFNSATEEQAIAALLAEGNRHFQESRKTVACVADYMYKYAMRAGMQINMASQTKIRSVLAVPSKGDISQANSTMDNVGHSAEEWVEFAVASILAVPAKIDWFAAGVLLLSHFDPLEAARALGQFEQALPLPSINLAPILSHFVHVIMEKEHPDVFYALCLCQESMHILVTRWHQECFLGVLNWEDVALYVSLSLTHGWEYQVYFMVEVLGACDVKRASLRASGKLLHSNLVSALPTYFAANHRTAKLERLKKKYGCQILQTLEGHKKMEKSAATRPS